MTATVLRVEQPASRNPEPSDPLNALDRFMVEEGDTTVVAADDRDAAFDVGLSAVLDRLQPDDDEGDWWDVRDEQERSWIVKVVLETRHLIRYEEIRWEQQP